MAYELVLLESYQIYPVFHVSLLKPAVPDPFPGRNDTPPLPLTVEMEFKVESILNCRNWKVQIQYLLKWKGYTLEENLWEP